MPNIDESSATTIPDRIQWIYLRARDARKNSGWDVEARQAVSFRYGNQLSKQEHGDMQSVGQPDIVIDRIHAAVDRLKAFLTARNPKFTALPREDSDQKLASTWRIILEYIWDISNGNVQFKQAVDDYATVGVGYFMGYIDREADAGKGEVKMKYIPWSSVYWDSSTRDRMYDDADYCLVSTYATKHAILNKYPKLGEIQENGKTILDSLSSPDDKFYDDYPTEMEYDTNNWLTPDRIKDLEYWKQRYRILTFYEPVKVPFFWIAEQTEQGMFERLVTAEKFEQLQTNEEFRMMVNLGGIQFKEVMQTRWRETAVIGEYMLYQTILDTDVCPIVPMPNIWTGTPFPLSDINKNKDAQRLLNKIFSTITMHLQTSAGSKLLVPEGAVDDIGELERSWANPMYVGEFNAEFGAPITIQTAPLASEAYYLIDRLEAYIDLNFGISELSQGLKGGTTGAVRTDLLLQEQGESRGKSKLQDIEASLSRVGQVCKNLAQGHYQSPKLFQIVQPNNGKSREVSVNIYTDRGNEVAKISNDITIGKVDVKVVAGSSLPSNRQTEEQVALQLYEKGIVPKKYVAQKADIDDYDEWLKEMDETVQLQGQVKSLTEQNQKQGQIIETQERELRHADRQVEKEKFKADLDEIEANAKADAKTEKAKLGARSATITDRALLALKELEKQGSNKKDSKDKS